MGRAQLRKVLDVEKARWAGKPFGDLVGELRTSVHYSVKSGSGQGFQVEVQILEQDSSMVHVSIAVDDRGWRAFLPMTDSFIVYADGRVDR